MLICNCVLERSDIHVSIRAAQATAQRELFTSFWMRDLEWTVLPVAVCWLVTPSHAMASVTVVRITVTEPQRYRAAPFALEVNVFSTMLVTVGDTSAYKRS